MVSLLQHICGGDLVSATRWSKSTGNRSPRCLAPSLSPLPALPLAWPVDRSLVGHKFVVCLCVFLLLSVLRLPGAQRAARGQPTATAPGGRECVWETQRSEVEWSVRGILYCQRSLRCIWVYLFSTCVCLSCVFLLASNSLDGVFTAACLLVLQVSPPFNRNSLKFESSS